MIGVEGTRDGRGRAEGLLRRTCASSLKHVSCGMTIGSPTFIDDIEL